MTKPWIGYVRLSTLEQADTNALRNQIDSLRAAGAEEVFYDIESGQSTERPNLKKVLELVVDKEIAGVLSTRWDRLTRDYGLFMHIKELIRNSEVQLRLLDQGTVDLQTASGELYADLQVVFAVHELRELRQRVKRGFQKRRDREASWSRPPWGYYSLDEKYEPDFSPLAWCGLVHRPDNYQMLYSEPDDSVQLVRISKAQVAREVFDFVLESRSPAKTLNYLREAYNLQRSSQFTPQEMQTFPITEKGLKEWLRNPIFSGHIAYLKYTSGKGRIRRKQKDWDIRHNKHQSLISDDETQELQEILSSNCKKRTPLGKTSYLTGLVFCNQCHQKCTLKTGGRWKYYGCQHAATTCGNRGNVPLWKIEKAFVQAITQKAWRLSQKEDLKSDILLQLEEQYQKLLVVENAGSTPALRRAKEDLQLRINEEINRADRVAARMLRHPQAQKINFWYTLTQEERRIFYEKLIERVIILGTQVSSVVLKV